MFRRAMLLLTCWLPAVTLAAGAEAVVTIQEGEASLVRGVNRLAIAEGVRLHRQDVVETGASTGLLRLEFADGTIADLGPDTAILLAPRLRVARGERRPDRLYLLRGWIKLTPAAGQPAAFASPQVDLQASEGVTVSYVSAAESIVFAESGGAELTVRQDGKAAARVSLRNGEAHARRGAAPGDVQPRPPADMLERMPRAFRDSLPVRIGRYQDQEVLPQERGTVDYDAIRPWLQAERAVRLPLVNRWKPLAEDDDAFRRQLVTHMRAHPEWDRVLFPEKYLPRPPVAASGPVAVPASR